MTATWPNVPFYIMSQVNFSDLVVAVNSDNQAVLLPLTGTADQLWVATADERGGARLTNLLSKMALYARPADPTWVGAGPLDLSVPGACWVLDDYPQDGWLRIQCLPPSNNWWLQVTAPQQGTGLILAGWDGGQLSEFKAMPETGAVTVSNVEYQLANAANLAQPPVDSLAVVVDNTQGNTLLTQTITLTGTVQQSTQLQASESDTEGTVYTQSFSVEATFDPVQVTATATFEENQSTTVGWSSGTTNTQTWEHDIQTAVTVPAEQEVQLPAAGELRAGHCALDGDRNVPVVRSGHQAVHVPDERRVHWAERHDRRGHRGRRYGAAVEPRRTGSGPADRSGVAVGQHRHGASPITRPG